MSLHTLQEKLDGSGFTSTIENGVLIVNDQMKVTINGPDLVDVGKLDVDIEYGNSIQNISVSPYELDERVMGVIYGYDSKNVKGWM